MPSLLEQVNAAAGRPLKVIVAEDIRAEMGVEKKEFYGKIERNGRVVDMREFVTGADKPTGLLMILVTERREGLLVQLWELLKK